MNCKTEKTFNVLIEQNVFSGLGVDVVDIVVGVDVVVGVDRLQVQKTHSPFMDTKKEDKLLSLFKSYAKKRV